MFNRACLLAMVLLSTACTSTHMSKVEYEGEGIESAAKGRIGQVVVSDKRGTDSDWLGAIRGGYGNRLKTLRTERSTDVIVDAMYTEALERSGLYTSDSQAAYKLNVVITKFDCSYYFNREAHAHVDVSLIANSGGQELFSKAYKTDLTEGGVGAGIFGDVETLRNFSEEAMNQTIDKMLNDSEFQDSLLESESIPSSSSDTYIQERLNKLQKLYDDGMISDQEYSDKRRSIISEV